MTPHIKKLLETVATWPDEDQEELAEMAREIAARRTGAYFLSDDERAAVQAGLAEADRDEFVIDEEMADVWKRCAK